MVSYEEFKGNKMIVLKNREDDKFPMKFGLGKARLILANIEAIKKFAEGGAEEEDEHTS